MLKIYKNKTTTFKCEINVEAEGKNVKNVKSRLILYPMNDNRNVMFEGIIQDNTCTVEINPDINISKNGKAVLEIIIDDSAIFRPWNSLYEIYTSTVTVEGAEIIYDANRPKVVVNEIKDTPQKKQRVRTKKVISDLLEEAANMITDVKEVKDDNKSLLAAYTDSIKSLSKEELKSMVDFVKKRYSPKKHSLQWAKKMLGENTSTKSKLLMYCNELKTKGEVL